MDSAIKSMSTCLSCEVELELLNYILTLNHSTASSKPFASDKIIIMYSLEIS